MNKKIILISCIFLLTGCSARYNLYLDDYLTEKIYVFDETQKLEKLDSYDMNSSSTDFIENYKYNITKFQGEYNFTKKEIEEDIFSGIEYENKYYLKNIDTESMIYDCYDSISITKGDTISITTSKEFKCFEKYSLLDDVTINIYSSDNLIKTNADNYGNGIYTWNIDKDNYNNKEIYLEVKQVKTNHTFQIIGGVIFAIVLLVAFIIYKKRNSEN